MLATKISFDRLKRWFSRPTAAKAVASVCRDRIPAAPTATATAATPWTTHNDAQVIGHEPLRVRTDPRQWAYALSWRFDHESTSGDEFPVRVRVLVEVASGCIGALCVDPDLSTEIARPARRSWGGGLVEFQFVLERPIPAFHVVIRNESLKGVRAEFAVRSVGVGSGCDDGLTEDLKALAPHVPMTKRILIHSQPLQQFRCWSGRVRKGYWANWLGVMTRADFWKFSEKIRGQYERDREESFQYPLTDEGVMDWYAMLEAVLSARGTFNMVALGAGWGRWLSGGAFAATQLGLEYRLVGVEAEPAHFEWMKLHFEENGIPSNRCRLIHAAASGQSGHCWFYTGDSDSWYGQSIVSDELLAASRETPLGQEVAHEGHHVRRIPTVDLAAVLEGSREPIDYMHMDIQGAEFEFLQSRKDLLDRDVKLVNIGTHSEEIEMDLRKLFGELGWIRRIDITLNSQVPARFDAGGGRDIAFGDGVQVWQNPKFPCAAPRLYSAET